MSIIVNRPDNPRRPPDWRWQRGNEIVSGASRHIHGRDDATMQYICKFIRLLNRCRSETDHLAALDAAPALYDAYTLYRAEDVPSAHRWELEARILAREPVAAIGSKLGLTAATVEMYERVFFDVISRLQHASLIMHTVIGQAAQTGLAEREYDGLWKLLGFTGGPAVLDAVIHKCNSPARPLSPEDVNRFYTASVKHQINEKAFIALHGMPVTWQTYEHIYGMWLKLLEVEAATGQAGMNAAMLVEGLQVLVNSMEFKRQNEQNTLALPAPAAAIEATGVRLRASELAALTSGSVPADGIPTILCNIRYPDNEEPTHVQGNVAANAGE